MQGIHNIFIVVPQFLVTGFAALLFAIVDPGKPALPGHRAPVAPHPGPASNLTLGLSKNITDSVIRVSEHMLRRTGTEVADVSQSNSTVYIFRCVTRFHCLENLRFMALQCWGRCCLLCFRAVLAVG